MLFNGWSLGEGVEDVLLGATSLSHLREENRVVKKDFIVHLPMTPAISPAKPHQLDARRARLHVRHYCAVTEN